MQNIGQTRGSLAISGGLFGGLPGRGLAPPDLLLRIHCAAALLGAAVAQRLIVAAVVEAVIVGDLLADVDVADGRHPDPVVLLAGLAVGVATVVDEHRRAMAVDADGAVAE